MQATSRASSNVLVLTVLVCNAQGNNLAVSLLLCVYTDFVLSSTDIDWEYPGGGGADYKLGNAASSSEEQIKNYPSFLGAIKAAIGGGKELSIAVPGLDADMGAFTPATCQAIVPHVDFVNVSSPLSLSSYTVNLPNRNFRSCRTT